MKLTEAKQQFVSSWGAFGTHWGINRSMAQIHALLLVSAEPLTQDEIMEQLTLSRGNANMNIRELINWGLVERLLVPGERREYFRAEKEVWKVMRLIIRERKKREVDPMLELLEKLENLEGDKKDPEAKAFLEVVGNIRKLGRKADRALDLVINSDESWFISLLSRMVK